MSVDWINQFGTKVPSSSMSRILEAPFARNLALSIQAWWRDHGYPQVTVEAVSSGTDINGPIWGVRSNLRNGLPPGADPKAIAKLYQHQWGGK